VIQSEWTRLKKNATKTCWC